MKNFIRYNVVKCNLSLLVAGILASQSALATLPAPKAAPAVGNNGFDSSINIVEATRNKRGLGLSDAKKIIEQGRKLVAATGVKETTVISGVSELQRAFLQEAQALKQLKSAMEINMEALKILRESPIDNDMRMLYGVIFVSNLIPVWMARNDKNNTPIITWKRETVRAWLIALPMMAAAYVRAKDPTAALSMQKINEELEAELTKLKDIPGATGEFGAEINKILDITANQVETAAHNYSTMEEGFKKYFVGQGTDLKLGTIMGTEVQVNFPTLIMLGSVAHAALQTTEDVFKGPLGKMAGRGKILLEVAAKNSDQIRGIAQGLLNGGKVAAGRVATAPGRFNDALKSEKGALGATGLHVVPDALGQVMVDTQKDVMLVGGVISDFRIAVDTINSLIKDAESKAAQVK